MPPQPRVGPGTGRRTEAASRPPGKGWAAAPGFGQLLQTKREAPPRMPVTHPGRGRAPLRALQRPQ